MHQADSRGAAAPHGHRNGRSESTEELLRTQNAELARLVEELRQANHGIAEARRAALNVMEDAMLANKALRESNERLRVTMESATDYAIITMDRDGMIAGWSAGAERIFGYREAEVLGKPTDLIFTPEDVAVQAPLAERLLAEREGYAPDERWHMRKDGSRFYLSGVTRPIYNPLLTGFVKLARDLTKKQQAEETLRVSEERYRVALQSAAMAAWDWDVVPDRIRWNDQHFLLLGLKPDDRVLDAGFFLQFVHPDDAAAVRSELTQALDESGQYRMESFRIIRTDGATRWMTGFGRVLTRKAGQATRMVGVMYDITERITATQDLRDQQLKLEIAQRAARVGIWGYDLVKQQGIASPEWNELTGYPVPGDTFDLGLFLSLVHPDDQPQLLEAHNQAVREKSSVDIEFRIQHAERGTLWLLKRGQYIPPYNGMNATLMGSLIDITERKRLEEQKDEFVGIASHELRTPVTSIKAYAEVLREMLEENGDTYQSNLMQKLNHQVDRLTSLIHALLDTTRISEGKLRLDLAELDLDKLIADTCESLQGISAIPIITGLHAGVRIAADRERLRQVLTNLITNALKYAPDSERIEVRSFADRETVTVCVRDYGPGIPEPLRERIFERFFGATESGSHSGLGLGLFISAAIVHRHGGTIWVQEHDGTGALFCFRLPLLRDQQSPDS